MSCIALNHCIAQPQEMLYEIFKELELGDLISCQGACKRFYHCIKKYEDQFYNIFAEKAFFFFRREGFLYFNSVGKVKNRFVADYTQILNDCRIKRITIQKASGLAKICLLQDRSKKPIVNCFYSHTWMCLLMKAGDVQERWKELIPFFKLGVIYDCIASRLFMLASRAFSDSKPLRDQAYLDLFLFHKTQSPERDAQIWGSAAFHADQWNSTRERREFLEKGGEIASAFYKQRRVRLQHLNAGLIQGVISNVPQSARN